MNKSTVVNERIVIMGSGPAGLTAAIYAARGNLNPLLLGGNMPGGLLTQTNEVENFPGFPQGVHGFELMMKLMEQAEKFGTRIEHDHAVKVELSDGGKQVLHLSDGRIIEAEALIIATGASPRYLGLDSEDAFRNRGVSACATCDGAFYKNLPVCVIGGGDSAVEEAIYLTSFTDDVTLIHRRGELRASKIMSDRAKKHPKLKILWNTVVEELQGADKLEKIRVKNIVSGEENTIPCNGFFLAIGHHPNTDLFKEYLELDKEGFLVRHGNGSQTCCAGVFIAGDCCDPHYRQAVVAAGMGAQSAIDAERYLRNKDCQ